jgi:hypothetical protein
MAGAASRSGISLPPLAGRGSPWLHARAGGSPIGGCRTTKLSGDQSSAVCSPLAASPMHGCLAARAPAQYDHLGGGSPYLAVGISRGGRPPSI